MNIGMVFGIIFAIIVIAFVTAFAIPQIINMFCNQEQIEIFSTLNDLQQKVNEVYFLSEGSMMPYVLNIPGSVKFCFVNVDSPSNPPGIIFDESTTKIVEDNQYNIWYTYCKGESGKKIDYLSIDDSFCMQGSGKIYLENRGTHVGVTRT